jgi:hypothetical protein|tara:strand:+ start:1393 stop:1812 length:420 start_codon:yes stop_codon:yes gene_type:complete
MTSSYNDIRAAIEARIATEMAESPSYQVSYENVPFTPPNNGTWIKVRVRFGANNYATLIGPTAGSNRQAGVVVIDIFSPIGVGTGDSFTLAERLKDLFDRKTVSQIIFDAADGPTIIDAAAPESFFQTELAITFNAFVQ